MSDLIANSLVDQASKEAVTEHVSGSANLVPLQLDPGESSLVVVGGDRYRLVKLQDTGVIVRQRVLSTFGYADGSVS